MMTFNVDIITSGKCVTYSDLVKILSTPSGTILINNIIQTITAVDYMPMFVRGQTSAS